MLKRLLKRLLPSSALRTYHKTLAQLAALAYGDPSSRMVVIGVTGTNGKSTTANMIARALEGSGKTVGLATTCNFRIAGKERINATKMTMLGRFALQKLLARMLREGCTHAVIETSSEGIAQYRHIGVKYDAAVLTNLTPEHLESHGGFEKYKAAKLRLFERLGQLPEKKIGGETVPKVIVVNLASPHAKDFLGHKANKKYGYVVEGADAGAAEWPLAIVKGMEPAYGPTGASFMVRDTSFHVPMLGPANVENALAAIATGMALGLPLAPMAEALATMPPVPGRQERIDAGQDFVAMVDYAHEPEAMRRLYEMLAPLSRGKTIHIIGSAGGGRDKARRSVLGRMAADLADVVVVTNEDPYDEDPRAIIDAVAAGAHEGGKKEGADLFVIDDRRAALDKAVALAEKGDLVLSTGKGSEQWICVADSKKLPWDERVELRAAIERRMKAYGTG